MERLSNYIDGKLLSPHHGAYLDNINPANQNIINCVPSSTEEDLQAAVESAQKAQIQWRETPVKQRAQLLFELASRIQDHTQTLAEAETRDTGKPFSLSVDVEIPRAVENLQFFGSAILQGSGKSFETQHSILNFTLNPPLGIVACISPWNLPLYLLTWKIAPALASGNCVIAKPSELAPTTATLMAELTQGILPPGVFNLLHGRGNEIGQLIVEHQAIKGVSFTGGTQTGIQIYKTCAQSLKKVSLELGGKNPSIVFKDCELEKTLSNTVRSGFTNSGQICLCGSRLLIENEIYSSFKEAFLSRVCDLIVGDPFDSKTQLGPLISESQLEKVDSAVQEAKAQGAKILCGGKIQKSKTLSKGYYYPPTVIEGLDESAPINQTEIFGPVVSLLPFKSQNDAIKIANSVKYGLSASVWTSDFKTAHEMAHQLDCGIVWINSWLCRDLRTPFGGSKHSGIGREGGFEALNFFTEPKNVCMEF